MGRPFDLIAMPGSHLPGLVGMHQSTSSTTHPHESVVIFLNKLAQASDPQIILEGGVLDFLLGLYIVHSSHPLPLPQNQGYTFRGELTLQIACDSLLRICSTARDGLKMINKHQLSDLVLNRLVQRAAILRSMKPGFILFHLRSISNKIQELDKQEPLGYIRMIADMIEFLG